MLREPAEPGAAGGAPESSLESWKEIAVYLNRHVTTVRRWEKHEGLPVHRHVHEKLGSVYAFRQEIDDWRRQRRVPLEGPGRDEEGGRGEPPRVRETWLQSIVEPWRTLWIGSAAAVFALVCACIVWVSWHSQPSALPAPPRSTAVRPFTPLVSHDADELLQTGATEPLIAKLSRLRRQDTQSAEAYEHYLFGRYHLDVRESKRMLEAEREFRAAIRLDPQYAHAYSGLALALLGQAWLDAHPGPGVVREAGDAALKALALDGSIALAHSVLGEIAGVFESDPAKAEREHRLAFQLDQRDPWVLRSYTFFRLHTGDFDDALELNRRDLEQEPTSPLANRIKAQILYVARRYDDCVAQSQKTLLLDARNLTAYKWLALCLEAEGRRGEAIQAFETQRTIATGSERTGTLLHFYEQRGWDAYWRERLRQESRAASWLTTADMRVRVGDVNEALRALERGFDAREPAILSGLNHPRWDPLRGSPRFQALSQRSKLTAARNLQSMVSRPLSDVAVSQ